MRVVSFWATWKTKELIPTLTPKDSHESRTLILLASDPTGSVLLTKNKAGERTKFKWNSWLDRIQYCVACLWKAFIWYLKSHFRLGIWLISTVNDKFLYKQDLLKIFLHYTLKHFVIRKHCPRGANRQLTDISCAVPDVTDDAIDHMVVLLAILVNKIHNLAPHISTYGETMQQNLLVVLVLFQKLKQIIGDDLNNTISK